MTMTISPPDLRPPSTTTSLGHRDETTGARLDVDGLSVGDGSRRRLHDVTFGVLAGEIVAVAGTSGAGKSTLLETVLGIRPASAGSVRLDGVPLAGTDLAAAGIGYVPQDDIVHRELPLRRAMVHAARLRLPDGTGRNVIDRVVDETLATLDLAHRGDVRIGSLSGGERKRASVAVEMLTRPRLFVLDEPTSGLDPATAADLMAHLRVLARAGTTVLLTTHSPSDLERCDRVLLLAPGGRPVYVGPPHQVYEHFGVADISAVYRATADGNVVAETGPVEPPAGASAVGGATGRPGAFRQWWTLTCRNAEVLVRNRLTLAVLLGSPALVTSMMVVLFPAGALDVGSTAGLPAVQTVFWLAFAGFFFGLTYGLLQIVTEAGIFTRERRSGVRTGAYVASKVAVLSPILGAAAIMMLSVLQVFDRLPAMSAGTFAELTGIVVSVELAALATGLLASASVSDPAQATLALPMICFPQVLFAGGLVPLADMAATGRVLSLGLADRWAFESLGRVLGVGDRLGGNASLDGFQPALTGAAGHGAAVLAAMTVVLCLATGIVLEARARPAGRRTRGRTGG